MGSYTPNPSDAIARAPDISCACHQLLAAQGISLPVTVFGDNPDDTADLLSMLRPPPRVIKLDGTQGRGRDAGEKLPPRAAMVETLRGAAANFLVPGIRGRARRSADLLLRGRRQVVAAMRRQAPERFPFQPASRRQRGGGALAHRAGSGGARGRRHRPGVAGVDLIRSKRGPLVLEINSSPGLED